MFSRRPDAGAHPPPDDVETAVPARSTRDRFGEGRSPSEGLFPDASASSFGPPAPVRRLSQLRTSSAMSTLSCKRRREKESQLEEEEQKEKKKKRRERTFFISGVEFGADPSRGREVTI